MTRSWTVLAAVLLLSACSSGSRLAPPVAQPAPPPTGSYVVQPGDSIYSVARELHLTVRALIDANQLHAPYQLQPGQRLMLPGSGFYMVAKGDNLSVIARKTAVPFATLARMNGLSAPYILQPGQKLLLPTANNRVAAAPVAAPPVAVPVAPVGATPIAPAVAVPPPAPKPSPPPAASATPPAASATPAPTAPPAPPPVAPAATPPATAVAAAVTLPPPPAKSGHGFVWPVKGEVIAEFGTSGKGQHNDGINIAAPRGTPVVAADSGVVAYAGNELRGFGNLLLIKHEDGWMTAYAHNDQLLVKRGDLVRRGQKIATVGDSGGVAEPQLHFELRQGTRAIDPAPVLAGKPLPSSAAAEASDPG